MIDSSVVDNWWWKTEMHQWNWLPRTAWYTASQDAASGCQFCQYRPDNANDKAVMAMPVTRDRSGSLKLITGGDGSIQNCGICGIFCTSCAKHRDLHVLLSVPASKRPNTNTAASKYQLGFQPPKPLKTQTQTILCFHGANCIWAVRRFSQSFLWWLQPWQDSSANGLGFLSILHPSLTLVYISHMKLKTPSKEFKHDKKATKRQPKKRRKSQKLYIVFCCPLILHAILPFRCQFATTLFPLRSP